VIKCQEVTVERKERREMSDARDQSKIEGMERQEENEDVGLRQHYSRL